MKGAVMRGCSVVVAALLMVGLLVSAAAAAEEKVEPSIVVEKGGVLVGKGKLIFEPSFQYTHITTQRLDVTGFTVLPTFVVGIIQIEKIKRDILVPAVTLKYGITDAIELDVRVPYLARFDKYTIGAAPDRIIRRTEEHGIGDVEGALLVHLLRERGARPDVIGSVRVKSRTGKDPYGIPTEEISGSVIPLDLPLGSGHWAVEPGVTIVKSADPAVIFVNASYFYHIKRDVGHGIGTVDPSDSINYSLGVAYALSDKVALSTAFEQKFYSRAKVEGEKLAETDVNTAMLLIGTSYALGSKTAVSLTLGIGLTEDSPDLQISLRMPIRVF